MWVNCILRSGLLFVTLSLAIAKHKQTSFTKSCCLKGTLIQAVDSLFVKMVWIKATVPEEHIKNIKLLKKKTKKLFMRNCRFQEQLLSFLVEDVFGHLQLQVGKEVHFVEDFHSLRQKLSHCISCPSPAREIKSITRIKRTFYRIGNKGMYKAISELEILNWIRNFLESLIF
ncbi:interleukin-26 [Orycteropus afer afer]|uniref:Interleukin family protein n=1 Tax=Orycteropus afer afer TaxID=1230840 RepID=A0A8B7AVK2_ORYAF|nr:interleukin-26 [Orycteropus afer afer]